MGYRPRVSKLEHFKVFFVLRNFSGHVAISKGISGVSSWEPYSNNCNFVSLYFWSRFLVILILLIVGF